MEDDATSARAPTNTDLTCHPPSCRSLSPADLMSSSYASTSSFPLSVLQQLVQRLVPELAAPLPGSEPDADGEDDRLDRLDELVSYCSDVLRS